MDRDEILIDLYKGRKINEEQFNKYFHPNGRSTEEYIYYVEQCGVIQYQLHAYIIGDTVDHVKTFKADIRGGGHYRPVVEERSLTASEKKYAYEIFDLCFINPALEELSSVINNAVECQAEYGNYRILKELKDGIQFISPDGTKSKLSTKVILHALEYSHQDISIIRDPSTAEDFIEAFVKTPYQPLFAILQTVDATQYSNYKELNDNYRFDEFDNIVCAGNIDKYPEYSDLLYIFPERIHSLCSISIGRNNYDSLKWILENTKGINYELNSCIRDAVRKDNYELFNFLIDSGKYKADPSICSEWMSAIYWAFDSETGEKYILPLLKHGKYIPDSLSAKLLDRISLDKIEEYVKIGLHVDQCTIDKIISEERWDVLSVIENNIECVPDTVYLLTGYINGKMFDKFSDGLSHGYNLNSPDLFISAFKNGFTWADELLRHEYNININDGELLFTAVMDKDDALVEYLLASGANPNLKHKGSPIILHASALNYGQEIVDERQIKICRMLINSGVDPSKTDSLDYFKRYPKDFKLYLCDWLAEHGSINCIDKIGTRQHHLPLYYILAEIGGEYDEELVLHYLKNGAVANAKGISRDALFVEACSTASLAVLEMMLKCGADINEVDEAEWSGLMRVLKDGDKGKIEFLIEHGANINYVKPESVKHFWGGDKIIPAKSVLDIAEEYCSKPVIDYLISNGAKHGAELTQALENL